MFSISLIESIGYLGSAFVIIAHILSSALKLRILALIGAFIFCIYGFMIESYPILIANLVIAIHSIVYIYKIINIHEEFTILETTPNSGFIDRFMELNYTQIKYTFPQFEFKNEINNISFYILRNMTIAGLFTATHYNHNTLKVVLDYVTPEYRDFKTGNYIHHQLNQYFLTKGYRRLLCESNNTKHIKYLIKMGYEKTTINDKTMYEKYIG